jgi:FKBP-type peptidyl-prolyl cis-trans isomerase
MIFAIAAALAVSCNKVAYRKTAGGMPYKLIKGKGKDTIRAGNIVKYNVTYKINDSLVNSTFGLIPAYAMVEQESRPYDMSELWPKLSTGDSAVITQMIDTFIRRSGGTIDPRLKKGDRLITIIKVLEVFPNDSLGRVDYDKMNNAWKEGEIITVQKYLTDKKISAVRTPSGAFVQVLNPGTGNLIDSGKYVSLRYTGYTFAGKKFDSNVDSAFLKVHPLDPLSFVVNGGRMTKGFDESMKFLRLGATAKLYVPSMLAYGPNPNPASGLKPFENLIFDVTVLDVKDKEPEMKRPQMPQQPEIKLDTTQRRK